MIQETTKFPDYFNVFEAFENGNDGGTTKNKVKSDPITLMCFNSYFQKVRALDKSLLKYPSNLAG